MAENEYLDLLTELYYNGNRKDDRTGTGTYSLFGEQLRFDLRDGFPLLTTKKIPFKAVAAELLWFLEGSTNVNRLHVLGATIWDEWAGVDGDLGPIYGYQWRHWGADYRNEFHQGAVDQISRVIHTLKTDPDSRRMVVSAWNVSDLVHMALEPCHALFQFYVFDGVLSCHMYQRSADVFLGVPFNIASYALLTHMVAQVTDLQVGDLIISFGDVHLYRTHVDQAFEQIKRQPRKLPTLLLNASIGNIDEFQMGDIILAGYDPHPAIKAPIAV